MKAKVKCHLFEDRYYEYQLFFFPRNGITPVYVTIEKDRGIIQRFVRHLKRIFGKDV